MSGPLERLLQGPDLELTAYPPGSRYHQLTIAEMTLPSGRKVRYLRRRFRPDPAQLGTALEHRVADADRIDNLAAHYLGDPLASWRIADANAVMRMEALTEETGRRIRIALPEGMQEGTGA